MSLHPQVDEAREKGVFMTATQTIPYIPRIITLERCVSVFVGMHLEYRQWYGETHVTGRCRADWDTFKDIAKRTNSRLDTVYGPVVRVELFHTPGNNQFTATLWDTLEMMVLQVAHASDTARNMLERLGVPDGITAAALDAALRCDQDVVVFKCGAGASDWGYYVVTM